MSTGKRTLRETPSIFRRTEDRVPELTDVQTPERPDVQASKRQRYKATLYLSQEAATALDAIQLEEFKKTGKRPERSDIASEAIEFYYAHRKEKPSDA